MLKKFLFKKNKRIKKIALIVGLVFVVLISITPAPAYAATTKFDITNPLGSWLVPEAAQKIGVGDGSSILNISFSGFVSKLMYGLCYGVFKVFGVFLDLASKLYDAVFNKIDDLGFTKATIVQEGWKITRDFSNMFFALILMIIAFATILRIESYGAKHLIKNVVVAALLINFSLVIAGVLIDFTQVMTNYFYTAAKGDSSLSTQIAKGLSPQSIMNPEKTDSVSPNKTEDVFLKLLPNLVLGVIVIMLATFVIFAGALYLVVRLVALWLLLILAPMAWLFMILPATKKYWDEWWHTFFKYAFFAPAYMFFLYLTLRVISTKVISNAMTIGATADSGGLTAFLLNYVILICMLIACILIAQKIGIYGSGAITGWAKSAGKSAGNWAKYNVVTKPARAAGALATGAGLGVLGTVGKIPGLGFIGRRAEAEKTRQRQKPEQWTENKSYADLLNKMSSPDVLKEAQGARGIRKLIATRKAAEKGLYNNAEPDEVKKTATYLRAMGDEEAARKLEKSRPDAIPPAELDKDGKNKKQETIKELAREGNLTKLPPRALDDEQTIKYIAEFASPAQVEAIKNVSPEYAAKLEKGLEKASDSSKKELTALKSQNLSALPAEDRKKAEVEIENRTKTDNKIQFTYASNSGNISKMTAEQQTEWAKNAGVDGMKKLKGDQDISVVAASLPLNNLRNILQGMNAQAAKKIVDHLRNNPGSSGHHMAMNDPYITNTFGRSTETHISGGGI